MLKINLLTANYRIGIKPVTQSGAKMNEVKFNG